MTIFIEIGHTPSEMGWDFKRVEESVVPNELIAGTTTAKLKARKGFLSPVIAIVGVEDEQFNSLEYNKAVSRMRSVLANTLAAIYYQKLAEAGLKESKVGLLEKAASFGVDVFLG